MQHDTTILQFTKTKTTYADHKAKMKQLKYFYDRGWISQAEAVVQFLDHLEHTTGTRPFKEPFPYKKPSDETKQDFIRPRGVEVA